MKISFTKKQYIGVGSVLTMLAIWKILALYFDSAFVLPHPEDTLVTVLRLFTDAGFLAVVGTTVLRGIIGFVISGILGLG
ncbi:MAG TPA: hypothetical protein ENO05_03580, partial [Bacteroides sp.]|nr:hypothetical protein [Bacteroides sp.]